MWGLPIFDPRVLVKRLRCVFLNRLWYDEQRKYSVSVEDFESHCESLGLRVEMHPQVRFWEDSGFSPLCLPEERFAKKAKITASSPASSSAYLNIGM